MAAVHKPQYMRKKKVSCVLRRLMYFGTSAVGIDAPQFESFYTVPLRWLDYLVWTAIQILAHLRFCCDHLMMKMVEQEHLPIKRCKLNLMGLGINQFVKFSGIAKDVMHTNI